MKITAVNVVAALPNFTEAEIRMIKAALDSLPDNGTPLDDTWLFDAMTRALSIKLTFNVFKATTSFKHWKKHAPDIIEFINTTFPDTKKITKTAISLMLFEALISDLKSRNVPTTIGTVVTNLGQFNQMLDVCFPDYRASNMAHLIVKALTRRKT